MIDEEMLADIYAVEAVYPKASLHCTSRPDFDTYEIRVDGLAVSGDCNSPKAAWWSAAHKIRMETNK